MCLSTTTLVQAQNDTPPPAGGALSGVPTAAEETPDFKGRSSILPEGKTLPEGVMRFRLPFKFASGSEGYDKDGNKAESGFKANASGTGAVFEYGLSDRISLQLLVPVVTRNEVRRDDAKFKNRKDVSAAAAAQAAKVAEDVRQGIAKKLLDAHACSDLNDCLTKIDNGSAVAQTDMDLGQNGTSIPVKAGTPFNAVVEGTRAQADQATRDAILAATKKPEDGKTGLGDVELGALYAITTRAPVLFSLGAGFRLPTGSFKSVDEDVQRPTGRGTLDGAVRSNVDVPLSDVAMLSWQHQMEAMLMKGKKNVEGEGTKDFERKGVRNVGFLKAALGLGAFVDALDPVGLYTMYTYDYDGEDRIAGVALGDKSQLKTLRYGFTLTGLPKQIPLSLDADYETPLSGKNVTIATKNINVTAKAYMRF
jgi:hypothetical protein